MVMAIIYAKCGEYDKALDEIEILLSEQTDVSVNFLKMNGNFEPLRALPRYQDMIRKYRSTASRL